MGYSRDERLALCAALDEAGPDAPTLCAGWTTRDLAAHLVLRERRPDASAGIPGGPLAGYTARVQQRLASRKSFPELVDTIRNGPPKLSPWAIPALDERANTVEFFVHHEDIRRAAPDWKPREVSPGLSDALWARLRVAKLTMRQVPVGVEFARNDDAAGTIDGAGGAEPGSTGGDGRARIPHDGAARDTGGDRDRSSRGTDPVGHRTDHGGEGQAGRHQGRHGDAGPGPLAYLI